MKELQRQRDPLVVEPYAEWENEAKLLIEQAMERRDISYKALSRMLEELQIYESPDQINRKVLRKRFSAAFFIACMRAMDVRNISLAHQQ